MDFTLHAVGDVAPCRADPSSIFRAAPSLPAADLVFGQMECPLTAGGAPSPHAKLAMRTAPAVAAALRNAGFSIMSVAGNHALDYGAPALLETVRHLADAGIAASGAGRNVDEAVRPAVVDAAGRRAALLSFSSILPAGYAADHTRPGCAPMRAYTHYHQIEPDQPGTPPKIITIPDQTDLARLVEAVRAAKEECDLVFVSMHWGIHFVRADIADYQRAVARAAIEAGADAVLGHHPHLLKGIDFHRGKPIFYSLGNFAIEQPSAYKADIHLDQSFTELRALNSGFSDQGYMLPEETRHTVIARCSFGSAGAVGVTLTLCRIDDDNVPHELSPGTPEFRSAASYLAAITQEAGMATRYEPTATGLAVIPGADPVPIQQQVQP